MPLKRLTFDTLQTPEPEHVVHAVIAAGIRETRRGPKLVVAYAGHVQLPGVEHDATAKGQAYSLRATRLSLN